MSSSRDPLIVLLAKQSTARLREMRAAAVSQIDDLQVQVAWIDRALAEKEGPAPRAAAQTSAGRKRGSKRDAIKRIMATDIYRSWRPADIKDELASEGIDATTEAVRVTLRRMLPEHEVERDDDGWKLASTNGSVQQPLAEAPSSGPEGYGL